MKKGGKSKTKRKPTRLITQRQKKHADGKKQAIDEDYDDNEDPHTVGAGADLAHDCGQGPDAFNMTGKNTEKGKKENDSQGMKPYGSGNPYSNTGTLYNFNIDANTMIQERKGKIAKDY